MDTTIHDLDDYPESPDSTATDNGTALALGIVLALLLVLVAAGLATYFVRAHAHGRREGEGQRSTTSFENPVYDYAQQQQLQLNQGGDNIFNKEYGGEGGDLLEPMAPAPNGLA